MESLHYLLMINHLMFQRSLLTNIKDTQLTLGQPKVLDYLKDHDGAIQKDIAIACQIEPATITSVLLGMENKGLIVRKTLNGNRRSLYVYLTDEGRSLANRVELEFNHIESKALLGFSEEEKSVLNALMVRIKKNMMEKKDGFNE